MNRIIRRCNKGEISRHIHIGHTRIQRIMAAGFDRNVRVANIDNLKSAIKPAEAIGDIRIASLNDHTHRLSGGVINCQFLRREGVRHIHHNQTVGAVGHTGNAVADSNPAGKPGGVERAGAERDFGGGNINNHQTALAVSHIGVAINHHHVHGLVIGADADAIYRVKLACCA